MLKFYNKSEPTSRLGTRHLPHWQQEACTTFVTWRLADSLPQSRLEEFKALKTEYIQAHPLPWNETEKTEFMQMSSSKIDEWIDQSYGSCILKDVTVRKLVTDSLHHHDGKSYDLIAYVVMPNHVHLMMTPYGDIRPIMYTIKRFTAAQINKHLGQTGPIWQKEYFDHLVRSAASFEKFIAYIRQNPQFLASGEFSLYVK